MPDYKSSRKDAQFGRRAAERALALRWRLDKERPVPSLDGTLLLATWSRREFNNGCRRCSARGGTTS